MSTEKIQASCLNNSTHNMAVYWHESNDTIRITIQGLHFNILQYCQQSEILFHRLCVDASFMCLLTVDFVTLGLEESDY